MLGREPTDERVSSMAARYGSLVEDAVVAAPLFEGVRGFLSEYATKTTLTVASAAPAAELQRILSRKAMDAWFSAVDGSPRAKAEIIKDHLRQFSTLPEEVVMVGDQPGDAEAAYQSGIRCILIGEPQDLDDSVTHVASFPEAAASLRAAIPAEERPSPKSLHSR
jgi:phosphoglycolate phosphatase-like HAD superfamily hydrolase